MRGVLSRTGGAFSFQKLAIWARYFARCDLAIGAKRAFWARIAHEHIFLGACRTNGAGTATQNLSVGTFCLTGLGNPILTPRTFGAFNASHTIS